MGEHGVAVRNCARRLDARWPVPHSARFRATSSTTSRSPPAPASRQSSPLIKTTLAREPSSRFTLLYGNRRQSSVLFHEELEDLKDRYLSRFALYNLFSREQQEIDLFNGRLDGAKVKAFADTLLPVDTIDEAFVCGPGAMIDEVEAALLDLGLNARAHARRALRRAEHHRRASRGTG